MAPKEPKVLHDRLKFKYDDVEPKPATEPPLP
eukprot:CAMPEP_0194204148 /NCGR_PEP_ID=MMETSP0156-20130528/3759_1 /TAXON_ID=33649 /ORGANISM="Thalassionema nitzschioides, Strain L26-B" /LENGTH=31 /DNA_ID= /DNA_START= /DNA_END= /DNA_ORIENTATION=